MIFKQIADDRKVRVFALSTAFLESYRGRHPNWGPVGLFTYKRTYARTLPDGRLEDWGQTVQRVVEGCFNIQKIHCRQMGLPWNEPKAQHSAQDMFQRIYDFKFSPPGRGLSIMGTDVVYERGSAALQNCAFISTDKISEDFAGPFCFLMDLSMLGVGVGADTRGGGRARIMAPRITAEPFVVADTREGWVDLIRTILNSFVGKVAFPTVIDYSNVRGRGSPIKTFGGVSSGPRPLQKMIEGITRILLPHGITATWEVDEEPDGSVLRVARVTFTGAGEPYRITSGQIVDVFNYEGKCVVAGGVRRTAEIMFGEPDDKEFITLKQDKEALNDRRWASNNSVFAYVGMDYANIARSLAVNGEPGLCWLDNIRAYSRMGDPADNKDWRAAGMNPCVTGDTLIAVADGRGAVPISRLAEEGADILVYCLRPDGATTIRMARDPRVTGYNQKILRVTLDNGTFLRVTSNHKMLLRDGTVKPASELVPGDALPTWGLEKVALGYNSRVVSVEEEPDTHTVYNLTVDEHHNYAICTKYDTETRAGFGVFVQNCGEQSLESGESCNLVETYPAHHDSYEDYERTLKMAYLYAKTVTLVPTHDLRSNAVMLRNRRIGCSMSGIAQAIVKLGRRQFLRWADRGYAYIQKVDRVYSDWLGIPLSIKTTSVKPSGSVSLLCGATPGIHYPHSEYYIRHIRVANTSPLVEEARKAGHDVMPDTYADDTSVIAFPVHERHFTKGKAQATIWEQFTNAADLQRVWADNAVSVTVTFAGAETRDIQACLEAFEDKLKGVAMLPLGEGSEDGIYQLPPYVSITRQKYTAMMAKIKPMRLDDAIHEEDEKFCTSDTCTVPRR